MNKFVINYLNNIKIYSLLKKEYLITKYSKHTLNITSCLYKQGLIQSFKVLNSKYVFIVLRYFHNKSVFNNIKIISKPSNIRYVKLQELLNLSQKKNILFFSTHKGILTLEECKKQQVGGKALFYIY